MALSPTYTRIHPPMRERCGGPQAGWTCILPVLSDCSPCGERCRVPNIRCVEGVAGPIIGNSIRTAVEVYELHGGPGKQFSSTLVSSAQHRCAGKIVVNAVPHMSWWVLGVCTLYRYLYLGTENKLGKSKPPPFTATLLRPQVSCVFGLQVGGVNLGRCVGVVIQRILKRGNWQGAYKPVQ